VVVQDHGADFGEREQGLEKLVARTARALSSLSHSSGIERTALIENGFRHADLAESCSMPPRRTCFDFLFAEAEAFGDEGE